MMLVTRRSSRRSTFETIRLLAAVEHAGRGPLLHQHGDLLVGHRRLALLAPGHQQQHGVARLRQQPDERCGQLLQQSHRRRDDQRDPFRAQQREALRHQLPEHHRQVGDDHDRDREGDARRVRRQQRPRAESRGQRFREHLLAHGARQHADRGDAHLDRREESRRLAVQRRSRSGARAPLLLQVLEAGAARGDDGHLRQREHRVERDQEQDQREVHR